MHYFLDWLFIIVYIFLMFCYFRHIFFPFSLSSLNRDKISKLSGLIRCIVYNMQLSHQYALDNRKKKICFLVVLWLKEIELWFEWQNPTTLFLGGSLTIKSISSKHKSHTNKTKNQI